MMTAAALRGRGPLARLALRSRALATAPRQQPAALHSRALAQPAALRSRALATAVRQKPEKAGPSRPTPEKAGPSRKFHPKAVTGMLMQAKDLEALLSICDRQRALEPIHVSAFWISLCRLEPRGVAASVLDGEALRALRLATLNQLPHMNPWSLANVCYALAQNLAVLVIEKANARDDGQRFALVSAYGRRRVRMLRQDQLMQFVQRADFLEENVRIVELHGSGAGGEKPVVCE